MLNIADRQTDRWKTNIYRNTRMTTSISSEARRNQTSILIRDQENHVPP